MARHRSLKTTPAVGAGFAKHPWPIHWIAKLAAPGVVHASRRSELAQEVERHFALHARPQLPPGNLGLDPQRSPHFIT